MAPTKSTKAPPPDFKRIKAKVGKRAPKPANLTDTAFKAASVSVRPQTVASTLSRSNDLVSSRGHSIFDLTSQLQHPAQAVRSSAAKGLKDLVNNSQGSVLWNHLSLVVPAVAKCCVDTEDQVREVGLLALKDLLAALGANAAVALAPFAPLLVATLSCALNSLDKDARKNGAMALEMLCRTVPDVVAPHVPELLPAFVRLLAKADFFKQQDTSKPEEGRSATKKRKISKMKTADGEFSLASALLSLLSTIANDKEADALDHTQGVPDLEIFERAGSRNALIVMQLSHPKHPLDTFEKLQDISDSFTHDHQSLDRNESAIMLPKTALDLMNSFRDALIEASQKGLSTTHDIETLLLFCKSIRYFWEFGQHMFGNIDSKNQVALERTCRQIGKLILEIFPLQQQRSSYSLLAELNAVLCSILCAFASTKSLEKDSHLWKKKVISHVLNSLASMSDEHGAALDSQVYILRVFGQLLFHSDRQVNDKKTLGKLVKAFCNAFFLQSVLSTSSARSMVGQEAFRLACALFELGQYDVKGMQQDFASCVVDIVRLVPEFLIAWRHEFPGMSYLGLVLLHNIARRSIVRSDTLLGDLMSKLDSLLIGDQISIFEQYPETIQRLFVSLLVMVGTPSSLALQYFGQICIRSRRLNEKCVSPQTVSLILHSLHTIRKNVPMQAYLTLVMDTTAVGSCTDKALNNVAVDGDNRPWLTMMSYDSGLLEACQCYIDCGASRVLVMLVPLLSAWLEKCQDLTCARNSDLLRLRAALAIIAMFHLDILENSGSAAWTFPPNLCVLVCQAVASFLCCAPSSDQTKMTESDMVRWWKPVRALLSTDASLLRESFSAVCARIIALDLKSQSTAIACMSQLIIGAAELAPVIRGTSNSLIKLVDNLAEILPKDGPIHDQLGRMSARIALISEQSTQG